MPGYGIFLLFLAVPAILSSCTWRDTSRADLILRNGNVYTLSWDDPDVDGAPAAGAPFQNGTWTADAEAIAIVNGKILFVGSDREALEFAGETTDIIDLRGATVIPGAIESHGHVHELGEHHEQLDLEGLQSTGEMVDLVVQRAAKIPAGEWIIGWGWDEGAWADRLPNWDELNERVPDHYVVLKGLRGFAALGNRAAFEAAGFTTDSSDPDGGEIVRDPSGNMTGVLLNNAIDVLYDTIPERTLEQKERILLYGLQELAMSGYVAAHHAGVRGDYMPAYESLSISERLPIRVHVMLAAVEDNRPLLDEWLERGPTTDLDDLLQVRGVKAYYDGSLGSRGARMLEAYSDLSGHFGVSGTEYGFDEELVSDLIEKGFQVGVHAIGDEGNRHVLDFYEQVFNRTPEARANRHRIEHAQIVHPNDFTRIGELNLTASMEPGHAVEDSPWAEDRVGSNRIRGAYAWRSMRRSGATLIFNSDYSGTDHSLFYGLYTAVTRQMRNGTPPDGWYPEQAVTMEEALRAYTSWASRASHLETLTGTLEAGRWADISVLSLDPLNSTPKEVLDGQVYLTIVGGTIVFGNLPN